MSDQVIISPKFLMGLYNNYEVKTADLYVKVQEEYPTLGLTKVAIGKMYGTLGSPLKSRPRKPKAPSWTFNVQELTELGISSEVTPPRGLDTVEGTANVTPDSEIPTTTETGGEEGNVHDLTEASPADRTPWES